MLLDSARVPATVRYSVGCSWLSLKLASQRGRRLGMTTGVDGVTVPSSRAAAIVMTLDGRPRLEDVGEGVVAELGALLADVGVGVEGRVRRDARAGRRSWRS